VHAVPNLSRCEPENHIAPPIREQFSSTCRQRIEVFPDVTYAPSFDGERFHVCIDSRHPYGDPDHPYLVVNSATEYPFAVGDHLVAYDFLGGLWTVRRIWSNDLWWAYMEIEHYCHVDRAVVRVPFNQAKANVNYFCMYLTLAKEELGRIEDAVHAWAYKHRGQWREKWQFRAWRFWRWMIGETEEHNEAANV
jgi:hypothetical protein